MNLGHSVTFQSLRKVPYLAMVESDQSDRSDPEKCGCGIGLISDMADALQENRSLGSLQSLLMVSRYPLVLGDRTVTRVTEGGSIV
jgi:hypothetical protein